MGTGKVHRDYRGVRYRAAGHGPAYAQRLWEESNQNLRWGGSAVHRSTLPTQTEDKGDIKQPHGQVPPEQPHLSLLCDEEQPPYCTFDFK